MARALSNATLSLGLVAIPVGLHATRRREGHVSYHLVHAKDNSRVKRQYVCEEEGVAIDDSELARAYEDESGEAVVMSADEAKAAAPRATGRIDLIEFVPADTLDAIYYDNAYFLSPGKGGDRAYHLLAATLRDGAMIGVGTQLARGKSYLVAVRATELGLVMHTLRHATEVHAEDEVAHGEGGRVTAAERDLARTLIDRLRKPAFDASRFEDEAEAAMRAAIAAHEKTTVHEAAKPARGARGKPADLMAALKASLESAHAPRAEHAAKQQRPRRHAPGTGARAGRRGRERTSRARYGKSAA